MFIIVQNYKIYFYLKLPPFRKVQGINLVYELDLYICYVDFVSTNGSGGNFAQFEWVS